MWTSPCCGSLSYCGSLTLCPCVPCCGSVPIPFVEKLWNESSTNAADRRCQNRVLQFSRVERKCRDLCCYRDVVEITLMITYHDTEGFPSLAWVGSCCSCCLLVMACRAVSIAATVPLGNLPKYTSPVVGWWESDRSASLSHRVLESQGTWS
jgi:hypothetical protein